MSDNTVNILLIEDNISDVELMEIALAKFPFPFTLSTCEDGEQACQYLARQDKYETAIRPDLILLDLNLPKKSGMEVLESIKSDPTLRSIPVIVLTTTAQTRDIARISVHPSTQVFTKPFRFQDYAKLIQAIADYWISMRETKEAVPAN